MLTTVAAPTTTQIADCVETELADDHDRGEQLLQRQRRRQRLPAQNERRHGTLHEGRALREYHRRANDTTGLNGCCHGNIDAMRSKRYTLETELVNLSHTLPLSLSFVTFLQISQNFCDFPFYLPTCTLRAECHRARRVRDPGRARSSSALDGLQYHALDALLFDDVLFEHYVFEIQALGERVLLDGADKAAGWFRRRGTSPFCAPWWRI